MIDRRSAAQFMQFWAVGGVNALVDLGVLNLLLLLHPTTDTGELTAFNTAAYTLAVMNSYIWNARLTFRRSATFRLREKLGFAAQAGVSLLIGNGSFIAAFQGIADTALLPVWLNYNVAKGLSMALSSTASFFFMKYLVFRSRG